MFTAAHKYIDIVMSKGIDQGSPKLELRLNISPDSSSSSPVMANSTDSASPRTTIDDSSCLSSEPEDAEITSSPNKSKNNSTNTTVGSSSKQVEGGDDGGMVLVGCPRCLMYVILSEVNPKCPICKSSVLLDLLSEVKNWSAK